MYFNQEERLLSALPVPETEPTQETVARQLALHGIVLPDTLLIETIRHCALLQQHAVNVMGWTLDEHIEPAPLFTP